MALTQTVFSEYEIRKMGIKVGEEGTYKACDCVGSAEEEMETLVVTKSCRGTVVKTRVRGTGNGTLTISAHVPYDLYASMFAMDLESLGLVDGVVAYGKNSTHPTFSIVMDVYDEDGNEKFKAYPNCIMQSGVARSTENGSEEVAEIEMEVSIMPDENGNGLYEAVVNDLGEDSKQLKTKWMTAFEPTLVQSTPAA